MIFAKRRIWYLAIIQAISMGAMEMTGPFWPLRIQSLLANEQQNFLSIYSTLVYVLPLIGAMISTPFWGVIGDRVGHKPMLLRALIALIVCQWSLAFITHLWGIVVVRGIQGMLAGFISAAQAYALVDCPSAKRGWVLARLQAATAAGATMGPVAGGLLLGWVSFSWICIVAGGICLICVGLVTGLPVDTPGNKNTDKTVNLSVIKNNLHWLLVIIVFIQAAKMFPQPFFALYLTSVMHSPAWLIGASYAATGIALMLSAPLWGKFYEQQTPVYNLRLLEMIAWMSAITLCLTSLSHHWLTFIATRILWGIWQGALLPLAYALMTTSVLNYQRGFLIGLANSAAKSGALAGILLGGLSMFWPGIVSGFWIVGLLYSLCALTIRIVRYKFFTVQPYSAIEHPPLSSKKET